VDEDTRSAAQADEVVMDPQRTIVLPRFSYSA
jgi:hypothetical protein